MKTVSQRCRETLEQNCHLCEDKACGDNVNPTEPVVGYVLTRSGCSGWMFAGVSYQDVIDTIACELADDMDMPADERDTITLTPYATTQAEIDSMPEFPGW